MAFFFENTKNDIIMTEQDEENYRKKYICRFCEKKLSDKVRDDCHLTDKYRRPAHSICNIKFTQKQSSFLPFVFHNFSE